MWRKAGEEVEAVVEVEEGERRRLLWLSMWSLSQGLREVAAEDAAEEVEVEEEEEEELEGCGGDGEGFLWKRS